MDSSKNCVICMILVLLAAFACPSSHAFQFVVGGKEGWTVHPKEQYSHWAQRMRFQVNDTLLFKYDKTIDSVLEVNKTGYDECDTDNAITKLDDSNPIFKFDRSGLFFFISGNKSNCYQLQKVIILVMHVRNRSSANHLSPTPAPARGPAPAPHYGVVTHGSPSPAPSPWAVAPVPWADDEPADSDGHKSSFGKRDRVVMRAPLVVLMSFVIGLGFVGWF